MNISQSLTRHATMLGALLVLALPLSGNSGCATTGGSKSDEPQSPDSVYQATLQLLTDAEEAGKRIDYKKLFDGFNNACALGNEQGKPHAGACYNAGFAASKQGRNNDAAELYRQALAADPGLKSAAQNLTVALQAAGKPDAAIPIYEDYLKSNPEDLNMVNNYAGALGEAGRHNDGVLQIQKLLYKDPKNTRAYKTLARIYFLAGSYRMSQMASGNALKLDDKDADIHNNIALTFLKEGKEAEAVVAFKKALELDEENLEANMNLGLIAVRAADYETAGQCFSRVLKQEPGNAEARVGLATAYRGNVDFDSALSEYDTVLGANKCDAMALKNKAMVQFLFQKKFKDTLKTYSAYRKCYPDEDITQLTSKVEYEIAEQERTARELAELERQMAELERKAKEKATVLTAQTERGIKVFQKYASVDQDPSWEQVFVEYVGNNQFAIESEDFFFMEEAGQYFDEFMLTYYKDALEMDTEEWTSGVEIVVPVAAPAEGEAAPAEGEAAPAEGEAAPAEGEAAPAEGEAAPAEGEAAPAEEAAAPAEGEGAPAEGEAGE
jgi:tetratricopeptide (TPR) repeat protein